MRTLRVAFLVVSSAIAGPMTAGAEPVGLIGGQALSLRLVGFAESPRYIASGTHTCESGLSCVVTGVFNYCSEAYDFLKTEDCCPMIPSRSKSKSFAINYCLRVVTR
jgi:hypothetical protein